MPVDVTVPLPAPEAEDVQALGWDDGPDRLTHAMHDRLQLQVLVGLEVAGHLLAMRAGRHQDVAVQRRIPVEKRDGAFVLVDEVVREVGIACDELADEASSFQVAADGVEVDSTAHHRRMIADVGRDRARSVSEVESRPLGDSDLLITPVGIGTAPIGSGRDWAAWWGPQGETESVRTIHAALDGGVNWIDTAPFYGWGRAEEIVGRALAGRRDDVLVCTKCGTLPDEERGDRMDLRPETIRADVEASLQRLGTDRLELVQLHDVDRATPIEESWGEVQRLIDEGKVRHGGISNHPAEAVERALGVGPVAALQYQYSLLHREPEREILPLARERGLGLITWSPLAAGFLGDGFDLERLDPDDFRRTHPFAALDLGHLRNTLARIGRRHGSTAAQVALAWLLRQSGVTAAIVGVRSEREAAQLPGVAALGLDPNELREIETAAP
jgi:aryl-alcohol dehydrogenase-like predicted oxidoreductase